MHKNSENAAPAARPAASVDPELAAVCAAWPALPANLKAAILALVRPAP